jgi:DNA-binding GntR family transcriptional regulator
VASVADRLARSAWQTPAARDIPQQRVAVMSPEPKYPRIARILRELIAARQIPVGGRLPSEGELAVRFGVARNTLRRALAELDRDGLVIVVPGKGRIVCLPGEPSGQAGDLLPAYRRIAAELRVCIEHGAIPPGERLQSEVALARRYAVSRETTRRALAELRVAGLATVVHGKGWFIRGDETAPSGTSQDVPPHVS